MKEDFKKAKEFLLKDGIIAFKTDTVMGVGVNGLSKKAVKSLFDLKKRLYDKPIYLLAYSFEQIYEYACLIPQYALKLMKKFFPGSLTLIFNSQKKLYTTPLELGETIGVRIPNYPDLIEFLAYIEIPLLNTSANFSNELPLKTKEDVLKSFDKKVFFVEFEHEIEMLDISSTIVDATSHKPAIIREGAVKI
ncbi:MAG: threonylcarbamoyl-AMP synthase [Caldisericaceae bacterium]